MERFISLLSWIALAVVLLAALLAGREPPRRANRRNFRHSAPNGGAANS
jgi:hypothetical protein